MIYMNKNLSQRNFNELIFIDRFRIADDQENVEK